MEAITRRLKRDKRGVSNVIVVMLSLVLITIIVANVVLWSYQMNQYDWERMQGKIEIVNVSPVVSSSWFVAQSEYAVNKGSSVSGFYTDTHSINDQCETFTEGSSGQVWPSNWNRRVKIAIDHNDVGEALSNFPVLVYLSNSSGRNNDNVSCVFTELQSKDNRKKIAVTAEDTQTQCFVEIEKWDDFNNQAWLWVKVPNISSSQDTVLYLYYDKSHADNTAYVGDPDSAAAENVWDNNYKLVMHLDETSGIQLDSTSNHNDGFPESGVTQNVSGIADGADGFDGTNDRIRINDSESLTFTNNQLTLEAWVKLDTLPTDETALIRKDNQWQLGFIRSNAIRNLVATNAITGWTVANDENCLFQTGNWYYWTFVYNGSTIIHKINAEQIGSVHTVTGNIVDNPNPVYVAYCIYTGKYLDGIIDELRISNVPRNPAWTKASYESEKDDLVAYGSEEILGEERNQLDVVGDFEIDLSSYPLNYVQTVEIQLEYRASDSGENWYLKTYNWTAAEYSDFGFNSTLGHVPTTSWDVYAVNLTDEWRSYVSESGMIRVKLQDNEADSNQTLVDIDFLGVRVTIIGTSFVFQNSGSLTSHVVSLWVSNSTHHKRYDVDVFINSGDSVSYIRNDIVLPDKPYMIKVVEETGNMAVFSGH